MKTLRERKGLSRAISEILIIGVVTAIVATAGHRNENDSAAIAMSAGIKTESGTSHLERSKRPANTNVITPATFIA